MKRLFNILTLTSKSILKKVIKNHNQQIQTTKNIKMQFKILFFSFIVNEMVLADTWKLQHSNQL